MPIRNLSRLALVLFALFATLVVASLLPFKPFDPAWQNRLTGSFVNAGTLPLFGLALLQLGTYLDPDDPAVVRRWQRFSRMAAAAALGFLLLIPLEISAGLRLQSSVDATQANRLEAAERKLSAMRKAVEQAGSSSALEEGLRKLSGPSLSPADLALPLPLLKAQVGTVFDQAQAEIRRQRNALPRNGPLRLLPELLRTSIASLALAIGYAIFSTTPGSELTLFDQIQAAFWGLVLSGSERHSQASSDADYLRQLQEEEDG